MRPLLRLVPSAFALTSLLSLAACSGAKPQLVEETPSDPASASPSTQDSGSSSLPSGDGQGTTPTGGSGSGGSSSGGTVGAPAPLACPADGVIESGSNGKRSDALAFTTDACGKVSPNGEDWWRFTLPSSATKLAFEFSGKVNLEITSQGETVTIENGVSSGPVPFHPNGEYEIGVTSETGGSQSYVLTAQTQ